MLRKRAKDAKTTLWRGGRFTNRLSRLRHLRGHGVHSPFVYSLVREVFMSRELRLENTQLFESLRSIGVDFCAAREISNLSTYCSYDRFSIDGNSDSQIIVCSKDHTDQAILSLLAKAQSHGTTIVILSPYHRRDLCEAVLKQHNCTSIDRFRYLILLNNYLPKQHFRL